MPAYEASWRISALDPQRIFTDPRILVWRSIAERENATFDFEPASGQKARWHIKRFRAPDRGAARAEAQGIDLLTKASIPTVPLVAWGASAEGRSFLITADLAGYVPADRLISALPSLGTPGEGQGGGHLRRNPHPSPPPEYRGREFGCIAAVAARLHNHGLHHRDLYLCHFLVHPQTGDVRLIDPGRVKRLSGWPFTQRWIVKDLAQLHYSARILPEPVRQQLVADYFSARGLEIDQSLLRKIERKSRWIAGHDCSLKAKRPERDVSLPPEI